MTAIARLTRAELRKLATTRTFLITLALSAGLAVISVVDAWGAGKNGTPPLGTTASTYQMLKFGAVTSVAMLVLGIISSGGEYRHKTIIPAMLITPRRGALIAAKAIATATAGVMLSGLTSASAWPPSSWSCPPAASPTCPPARRACSLARSSPPRCSA
jgi:hypothetical protein